MSLKVHPLIEHWRNKRPPMIIILEEGEKKPRLLNTIGYEGLLRFRKASLSLVRHANK